MLARYVHHALSELAVDRLVIYIPQTTQRSSVDKYYLFHIIVSAVVSSTSLDIFAIPQITHQCTNHLTGNVVRQAVHVLRVGRLVVYADWHSRRCTIATPMDRATLSTVKSASTPGHICATVGADKGARALW